MRQEIVQRIIFGFYSRNIQDSYPFVFLAFLALYANERKYVIRVVGGCKISPASDAFTLSLVALSMRHAAKHHLPVVIFNHFGL